MLSIHGPEAYSEIYTIEIKRRTSKHHPFIQGIGFDGDLDWTSSGLKKEI